MTAPAAPATPEKGALPLQTIRCDGLTTEESLLPSERTYPRVVSLAREVDRLLATHERQAHTIRSQDAERGQAGLRIEELMREVGRLRQVLFDIVVCSDDTARRHKSDRQWAMELTEKARAAIRQGGDNAG